jgi:rhodanese-related sulfurtransferase
MVILLSSSLLGDDYKTIDTESVKKLIDSKADYLLVDSLTPIHYSVEYVPTAINIQNNKVKDNLNLLPKDKSKMIIFYCMGPECMFSKNNAKQAISLGYTNVYVWPEGLPDWKSKKYQTTKGGQFLPMADIQTITPKKLKENLKKVFLISLFSKEENKLGLIPKSKVIHINNFLKEYNSIPKDKNIVIYSTFGNLDVLVARFLLSKGYSLGKLSYLEGGILAWKKAGFKIK